jgi:hypothetical protein
MIRADVAGPHCSAATALLTFLRVAVDENLSVAIKVSLNVCTTYENGVKLKTFFQRLFHAARSISGVFESASGVLETDRVLLAAAEPDVWTHSLKAACLLRTSSDPGNLALDRADGLGQRITTSEAPARLFPSSMTPPMLE